MNHVKTAVILAAGMGTRLASVTGGMIPKGFLEVNGQSLIDRSVKRLFQSGISNVVIVTGHLAVFYEALAAKNPRITTVSNPDFAKTGSMASLAVAAEHLTETFLLLESDLIYEKKALRLLLEFDKEDCILISGFTHSGDEVFVETNGVAVTNMSKDSTQLTQVDGELTGLNKISPELLSEMVKVYKESDKAQYHYEDALVDAGKVHPVPFLKEETLYWAEIDDASHLKRVEETLIPKLIALGEE